MWSLSLHRPFGSISSRRLTLFAATLLVALFTTATLATTQVKAQAAEGEVVWSGETLEYSGYSLERYDTPPNSGEFPNISGTACENNGPVFYSSIYPGPIYERGNDAYQEDRYWMHVICLEAGSDGSDKSQPISATLLDYSILKSNIDTDDLRGGALDSRLTYSISIQATTEDTEPDSVTTCDSTYTHGLGWAICPMTNWLAAGMDALYNILIGFLSVPPLTTDREGPVYYLWGLMRNAANILFIAGFLVIIYSQTTSVGLSNYGIKRLLPRLAIAAVLVNTSYWVAALAVDASNIMGVSLQNLLIGVRESIPASEGASFDTSRLSWQAIATAVLTGGSASIFVAGTAVGSFMATAGGSLWFLLVGLAGVMLSVLVAILILAARQALITILIIISPLAFVAYLLPVTENYFQRWRSLFTTMLMMFPIFSLIFGGSQLAGLAIIHTADPQNDNFFTVIILGMIVQVAPVIITPMLIKLSGSLLGRVAGFVNNPNRGIVDQTRKFAQRRQDMTKNRQMWDFDKNTGRFRNNNPLAQVARWNALRSIDGDQKLKTWEGTADAHYAQDSRSRQAHKQAAISEMMKSEGENTAKAEFAETVRNTAALRSQYYRSEFSGERAATETTRNKTEFEGLKADPDVVAVSAIEREIGRRARDTNEMAKSLAHRENAARITQERKYNEMLAADRDTQLFAGYDDIDPHGATRVANIGEEAEYKARETRIAAGNATLGRGDATVDELVGIVTGNAALAGRYAEFAQDTDNRSAAVRRLFDTAPKFAIQKVTETLDLSENVPADSAEGIIRSEVAAAMSKRKPFYVSQTRRGEIAEGKLDVTYLHEGGRNRMIKETLDQAGLDAEIMVTADREELEAVIGYFRDHGVNSIRREARDSLIKSLNTAFTDTHYSGRMGKSRVELNKIRRQLGLPPMS